MLLAAINIIFKCHFRRSELFYNRLFPYLDVFLVATHKVMPSRTLDGVFGIVRTTASTDGKASLSFDILTPANILTSVDLLEKVQPWRCELTSERF